MQFICPLLRDAQDAAVEAGQRSHHSCAGLQLEQHRPRALPGTRTMAGQSKAAESKKNPLSILGPAIFISVLSFASTLPLRPLLLQQILGDADAVSMMLARITASGALSEFIFNPLFGRASAFFLPWPDLPSGCCVLRCPVPCPAATSERSAACTWRAQWTRTGESRS